MRTWHLRCAVVWKLCHDIIGYNLYLSPHHLQGSPLPSLLLLRWLREGPSPDYYDFPRPRQSAKKSCGGGGGGGGSTPSLGDQVRTH